MSRVQLARAPNLPELTGSRTSAAFNCVKQMSTRTLCLGKRWVPHLAWAAPLPRQAY